MSEVIDDFEQGEDPWQEMEDDIIERENLFLEILKKPTATLRYIITYKLKKNESLLLVLGGIANSLDKVLEDPYDGDINIIINVVSAFLIGGFLGWVGYHIYAWALNIIGGWLGGGSASTDKYLTVLAWSNVPLIPGILIHLLLIIFFREAMMDDAYEFHSFFEMAGVFMLGGILIVLSIWNLIIMIKGVMLIQEFKPWEAIVNLLAPVLFILIPVVAYLLILN